jgi:hypothetical protein
MMFQEEIKTRLLYLFLQIQGRKVTQEIVKFQCSYKLKQTIIPIYSLRYISESSLSEFGNNFMVEKKLPGNLIDKSAISAILRIIIPIYTIYLLFILSIFFVFIPMSKKQMMDQKKEMISELTQSSWSLLSEYNKRVKQGELTLENAQNLAIERVRNLRYGPESKDYFWIIDYQHKVVMHPYLPGL